MTTSSIIKKLCQMLLIVLLCSCRRNDKEEYLIPYNYIGKGIIGYNQSNGEPIEYSKENKRIYRIGEDGALLTRFNTNPGTDIILEMSFYYINEQGKKVRKINSISGFGLFQRIYDTIKVEKRQKMIHPDSLIVVMFDYNNAPSEQIDSAFGIGFNGDVISFEIDTFKNLLKYQRAPDSIYFKQWKRN